MQQRAEQKGLGYYYKHVEHMSSIHRVKECIVFAAAELMHMANSLARG